MAEDSGIAWTHHTINPWWGCEKVSPACAFCYAERVDARFHPGFVPTVKPGDGGLAPFLRGVEASASERLGADLQFGTRVASHWGANAPRRLRLEAATREAFRYERRAVAEGRRFRVFCASMADFFEDRADLDMPRALFLDVMRRTPHLDWLILTKRPDRIEDLLRRAQSRVSYGIALYLWLEAWIGGAPPTNVALGTTVESQEWAAPRLDALLKVPARTHFVSVEPMLAPVDLSFWLDSLPAVVDQRPRLGWVICGGESGPRARPMATRWALSLVTACRHAGVPLFMKQLSEASDGDFRDFDSFPNFLKVRQFPAAFDYL